MWILASFFIWLGGILWSLLLFLWEVIGLALVLALPTANFLVWKSELRPNVKLIYVSVSTLMLLGIMMMIELNRETVEDDLYRRFDPDVTFYDRNIIRPTTIEASQPYTDEMGLDTCVDPEGNLVDLKKRFLMDNSWVLLEIPSEYLIKESASSIINAGGFHTNAFSSSAGDVRVDRFNKIKLEDFGFLDLYLKREKLKYAGMKSDNLLFFDMDGSTDDSFDKYIRTVDDYHRGTMRGSNVLFITSDNAMTNRLGHSTNYKNLRVIRCYDRTKQTVDYFGKQIASKLSMRDHYAYDSQARHFIEMLDFDMGLLSEFVGASAYMSVDEFIRDKIESIARSYDYLKSSREYFSFLKYATVKMIRGNDIRNRWIDYADLTDDSSYSRNLDELLNRAIQQKILVRHKNLIRFRLNSIFQAFISMS